MRRDIQALRGLAIVSVLFYHLEFSQVKGGFLGVDIFFVISGFVITARLDRGDGAIGKEIVAFYQKRLKRILPASLAVVILTAVASIYFISPLQLKSVAHDALNSSLFSANIGFLFQQSDYLAATSNASPFLHYWSLGVEEQFYLIWPLAFFFFFKKKKKWIPGFFLLSLIFALWLTGVNSLNSFYLPFSRFWEFLAGATIATIAPAQLSARSRKVLGSLGWIAMVASIFLLSTHNATPGVTTVIPVLGAALVIWSAWEFRRYSPLVWLGDISFSLYLVHWPIIVFLYSQGVRPGIMKQILVLSLSLLIAVLSYKFIENPFRFNKKLSLSIPRWALVVAIIAGGSFTGVNVAASQASLNLKNVIIDTSSPAIYANGCHLDFNIDWPKGDCAFGDLTSSTTIVLAGDSHAAQWFPVLEQLATEHHWKLIARTKSSCPALILETLRFGAPDKSCGKWQQLLVVEINKIQPAMLFIANYSQNRYGLVNNASDYTSAWNNGLTNFVSALTIDHSKIVLFGDTPRPTANIPECLTLKANANKRTACDFVNLLTSTSMSAPTLATQLHIYFLNPVPWFCTTTKCPAISGGVNVYRDGSHLSVTAVKNKSNQLLAALKRFKLS